MVYALTISLIYVSAFSLYKIPRLSNKGKRLIFLGISFTLFFLLASLRAYNVGSDTVNYVQKFFLIREHSFQDILSGFYTERVEIGYALLNKIVGLFTNNPRIMFVVNAAVIYGGMMNYLYRFSDAEDDLTSVILFLGTGLFFYSLNIMRQIMAGVLLLNAWGLLKKKHYTASLLLFFVSILLHISSAVFALVYLFYFLRNRRSTVAIILGVGALLVLFHSPIIKLISHFTDIYRLEDQDLVTSASGVWAIWIIEITLVLVFLFYYFFEEKFKKVLWKPAEPLTEELSLCVPVFAAFYIVFTYIGTRFNNIDRFGIFFLPFCIPLFINFGKFLKVKSKALSRIYFIGLHTCFIAYFFLKAFESQHIYQFFCF